MTTDFMWMRLPFKSKAMKPLFTFFLLSIFSLQLFAQGGSILSLTVVPTNPTVSDDIEVHAQLQFVQSSCDTDYEAFSVNGTSIIASAHHCMGMLTAICDITDVFEIGQLPAGMYTFDFTLSSGFGGPGCSPGIVPDGSDQIQFTVSSTVGIDEIENLDSFVYPNPVVDVLNLKRPLANTALITDASGKRVTEIASGTKQIDLSHLPNGIYVLHIGNSRLKLVKVN